MTSPCSPARSPSFDTRIPHWPAGDRPVEIPDGLAITNESDGTTVLRGSVVDQAALHGLLHKLRDVGIPLISLRQVPSDNAPERN